MTPMDEITNEQCNIWSDGENLFRVIIDTEAPMHKQATTHSHQHSHTRTHGGGYLPIPAIKEKNSDRWLILCLCSMQHLQQQESMQSLSPCSFKEDVLMVDSHNAGNTDKHWTKWPEHVMDIHGYLPHVSSYVTRVHNLCLDLWEGLCDAEAASGLPESLYMQTEDDWNLWTWSHRSPLVVQLD